MPRDILLIVLLELDCRVHVASFGDGKHVFHSGFIVGSPSQKPPALEACGVDGSLGIGLGLGYRTRLGIVPSLDPSNEPGTIMMGVGECTGMRFEGPAIRGGQIRTNEGQADRSMSTALVIREEAVQTEQAKRWSVTPLARSQVNENNAHDR